MDERAEWAGVLEWAVQRAKEGDFPVHEADDLRRHLRQLRLDPIAVALTILQLEEMDPHIDHDISVV